MRSLYKISLALLALGFLTVAGSAYAQECVIPGVVSAACAMNKPTQTLTGDIGAALGYFTFDQGAAAKTTTTTPANLKAYSELLTSWESNLRFTWQTDSFQAIGRARVRGNSSGSGAPGTTVSNDAVNAQSAQNAFLEAGVDFFTEVWWTPGAFKLGIGKYQGQAWSNPLSGNYVMRNLIGDGEYWMNWTGVSGLDAEYNLGIMQIGVAVANACIPSCNISQSNATIQNTEDNTMTVVPHINGKAGDILFRANLPFASGTINNNSGVTPLIKSGEKSTSTASVSGSGYQAGVGWAGAGGILVTLDVQGYTDAHLAALDQKKDRQRSGLVFRLDLPVGPGALNLGYFQLNDTCPAAAFPSSFSASQACAFVSSHSYVTSNSTIRYYIPVSFGLLAPEYRSVTTGGAILPKTINATQSNYKDATSSEFRLIMQARY